MGSNDRCGARATQALILRQEISEMVLTASLQVEGFLSEIDNETAEIRAVHDELTDRRDTAVGHSALASAIASGGGAIGSALSLVGDAAGTVGDYVGAVSGAAGAVFGFLSYFQQRGPRGCFPDLRRNPKEKDQCDKLKDENVPIPCRDTASNGGEDACKSGKGPKFCRCDSENPPSGCSPRMLYQLFCPVREGKTGFHSDYDHVINAYLGDGPQSRRGSLIQTWATPIIEQAKKEGDGKAEQDKKETDLNPNELLRTKKPFLFTSNRDPRKLSIDELTERANRLADLRAVVSLMNRDLGRLTEDLATDLQCPLPQGDLLMTGIGSSGE